MARHHYVPQFYLREWYEPGTKEFWLYFRDARGKIRSLRKPSKSIAYSEGLYAVKSDGIFPNIDNSDEIEEDFFGPIDSEASIVHRKIVYEGVSSLSNQDREKWAVFVNSLLERSPKRIESVVAMCEADVGKLLEESKVAFGDNDRRSDILELLSRVDIPVATKNAVLSAMIRQIRNPKMINYLCSMHWNVVKMPLEEEHFLTGDNPVVVNGGHGDKTIHYLSIALTPKEILIMHRPHIDFDEDFVRSVAISHSILITKQTEKYLISSRELIDAKHTKYEKVVRAYFL